VSLHAHFISILLSESLIEQCQAPISWVPPSTGLWRFSGVSALGTRGGRSGRAIVVFESQKVVLIILDIESERRVSAVELCCCVSEISLGYLPKQPPPSLPPKEIGVDREFDAGGSTWGDGGFLKLPRGMPGNGSLGLAANPGYPVKISANPNHGSQDITALESLFGGLAQLMGRRSLTIE
jgi:hypothetical protein